MKAGRTQLEVDTRVRITHIADFDERELIGIEGRITHPFPGLMLGSAERYVAGLWIDEESAQKYGIGGGALNMPKMNLCVGDRFEAIEPSEDLDVEASGPRM